MKKVFFAMAVAAMFGLAACNNNKAAEETVDSAMQTVEASFSAIKKAAENPYILAMAVNGRGFNFDAAIRGCYQAIKAAEKQTRAAAWAERTAATAERAEKKSKNAAKRAARAAERAAALNK